MVKNLSANEGDAGDAVRSLSQEDLLEEGMATYSNILAWEIPCTEDTGRLIAHGVTRNWTQLSN